MPYGFIQHIENKGYSPETVESYQKVTKQFFSYLSKTYKSNIAPHEINPSDIKNYLKEQRDRDKTISTINKELAILKTMFNFLWEINKVPIDPTVKIKRFKNDQQLSVDITYDEILNILNKVLTNSSYSKLRKAVFLLATKGFKTSDYRFKKENVKEQGNCVEIQLKNRIIPLNQEESSYFLEYYFESIFNGSDFVFTTKTQGEETGGPVQVMTILRHLRAVSEDYLLSDTHSLTLISIRKALAYDLYSKKVPIQLIAKQLGIEENSASYYLKQLTGAPDLKKALEGK